MSYFHLIPRAWQNDIAITGALVRGYSSAIAEFPDQAAIAAVDSLIDPTMGKFGIHFGTLAKAELQLILNDIVTFHGDEIK